MTAEYSQCDRVVQIFCFFWLIHFTFFIGEHCLLNHTTQPLTVIRDGKPWGFIMISGQIPVSQNGMSSWGTISPHTPAEERTFQFTNSKPPAGLTLITRFFFSVFLLLSFSWITFYPDSLPWPVLATCRLEESPCDRTGEISIPLHNAPSDLWASKLGKKALDTVFRGNQKLLTNQSGISQRRHSF